MGLEKWRYSKLQEREQCFGEGFILSNLVIAWGFAKGEREQLQKGKKKQRGGLEKTNRTDVSSYEGRLTMLT